MKIMSQLDFLCTRCLITAPNIVHLGVEETVSVQLHGATESASVTLFIRAPQGRKTLSETKTVNLNEDNQYQAVVTLQASPHNCCLFVLNGLQTCCI